MEKEVVTEKKGRDQFLEILPVSFRILNEKHEEKIYLEDKPSSANIEITNNWNDPVSFHQPAPGSIPGHDNYHLKLRFRPGVLNLKKEFLVRDLLISKGWLYSIEERPLDPLEEVSAANPLTAVLYLLNLNSKQIRSRESILLPIKKLQFDCEEGTQVTQVEMHYRYDDAGKTIYSSTATESHIRHFDLTIVNHRGNPHMPIHVGFTDAGTILNDGSPNSLTLRITNLQKKTPEDKGTFTIAHHKNSRIYLYFATGNTAEDYVLASTDKAMSIGLELRDPVLPAGNTANNDTPVNGYLSYTPLLQGDTPIWEIFPEDGDVILQPHLSFPPKSDSFDINLTNITADQPNGVTHLYLNFENIPGYWDHTYAIPISKQPLVIKGKNVGIGTADPKSSLEVNNGNIKTNGEIISTMGAPNIVGQFRAIQGKYGAFIRNDGDSTFIPLLTEPDDQYGKWNGLRPLRIHNQSGNIYFAASQVVINHSDGKIGIGIDNPATAKLVIGGKPGDAGLDLASADMYANLRVIRNTSNDKGLFLNYAAGANSTVRLYSNDRETLRVENNNTITNGNTRIANNGFSVSRQEGRIWNNIAFTPYGSSLLNFTGRIKMEGSGFKSIYFIGHLINDGNNLNFDAPQRSGYLQVTISTNPIGLRIEIDDNHGPRSEQFFIGISTSNDGLATFTCDKDGLVGIFSSLAF